MQQSYIIFVDHRTIEIYYNPELGNSVRLEFNGNVQVLGEDDKIEATVRYWVEEVELGETDKVIFSTGDPGIIYNMVESFYDKLILAAGGLVLNNNNEVLVIFRNGKWDLPKGKVEEGEQVEQAAIREVKEETGLVDVGIRSKLPNTYHTYPLKGKPVLKETYWYLMSSNDQETQPQIKEGITEVKWLPIENLETVLDNTYGNIEIILREIQGNK